MGDHISAQSHKFKTELTSYFVVHSEQEAGTFMLKTLRDRGFKTVIYEAGNDIGGTWPWNCYPGARVDSEVPNMSIPGQECGRRGTRKLITPTTKICETILTTLYTVLNIKKDCSFNTVVVVAEFNANAGKWAVRPEDGGTANAARRYIPNWKGIDKFESIIHHSSFWPDGEINVDKKQCAIAGTGASGVQIAQTWDPPAGHLKVFRRGPNLAIPRRRKELSAQVQERRATYEESWADGGFRFWVSIYKDNLFSGKSNKESYKFWVEKTRAWIQDPIKRDLLAPIEIPHYFGIKRPCLEHDYFEQFNRPNVDTIDVKINPIKEFPETDIILQDGTHHDFDVIAIAKGFDVVTRVMTLLGVKSIHDTHVQEEWTGGAKTYLGTSVGGYTNIFHVYGAHAPTMMCNGPSNVEVQGRWVLDMIMKMEQNNIKYVDPKPRAADEWKQHILDLNNKTPFPTTSSTYMGGNVPGKAYEPVCYSGGLQACEAEIRQALDSMEGFVAVKN